MTLCVGDAVLVAFEGSMFYGITGRVHWIHNFYEICVETLIPASCWPTPPSVFSITVAYLKPLDKEELEKRITEYELTR